MREFLILKKRSTMSKIIIRVIGFILFFVQIAVFGEMQVFSQQTITINRGTTMTTVAPEGTTDKILGRGFDKD